MKWLTFPRKPEPEIMDEPGEVEAYASAATQSHLNTIDDTFVDQALALGVTKGWALDVGVGPGSILLKIAQRLPGLKLVGIDRSPAMISSARRSAIDLRLGDRVAFCLADAAALSFPNACFDFVWSNSVLHHLCEPAVAFTEMSRVAKPGGVVLIRDLRRPSRLALVPHVTWFGRHYSGTMKKLYGDSVRAAYTPAELEELLRGSGLEGSQIFLHRRTHLGLMWRKPPREK